MIVKLIEHHIRGKPLMWIRKKEADTGGTGIKKNFPRIKARVRLWLKSASQNPRSPNDRVLNW